MFGSRTSELPQNPHGPVTEMYDTSPQTFDTGIPTDSSLVRNYTNYIKFSRGQELNSDESLRDFHYDEEVFIDLLEESPDLYKALYNREIIVYLHTDVTRYTPWGHMSADFPVLSKDGKNIENAHNIGLDPKPNSEGNAVTGTKGKIFEQTRSTDPKQLLKAVIRVTEEQYYALAAKIRHDRDDESIIYKLLSNNCCDYVDNLLKEIGIVDGLKNKFSFEEFQQIDWAPVKLKAEWYFDEFNLALQKVQQSSNFELEEFRIEEGVIRQREENLKKEASKSKNLSMRAAISMLREPQTKSLKSDTPYVVRAPQVAQGIGELPDNVLAGASGMQIILPLKDKKSQNNTAEIKSVVNQGSNISQGETELYKPTEIKSEVQGQSNADEVAKSTYETQKDKRRKNLAI